MNCIANKLKVLLVNERDFSNKEKAMINSEFGRLTSEGKSISDAIQLIMVKIEREYKNGK